jgi:hypothetical protein
MELIFGALGIDVDPGASFARACAATLASWPAAALLTTTDPLARIGSVARSYSAWRAPDGNLSVFLDGEILVFDGRETRDIWRGGADLAAVGELFATQGSEAWRRLDGSFLLIVRAGSTIHLGVDAGGARGVYWWEREGVLAFHSHLVELAAAYPGALAEDWGAIATYLANGLYPPGFTALRGIRHLGAGQFVTVTPSGTTAGSHFRLGFVEPSAHPARRLEDELIELVASATAVRWRSARDPVVPLSGGVDSRYVVAEIVRQAGPSSVRTITWGEEPDREDGDAIIAARVAARLGVENTWHAKDQRHTPETFAAAIHLSSGECDAAIHYPVDHVLHASLSGGSGFASLFRGDECLESEGCLTERAVRNAPGVIRLSRTGTFAPLLGPSILADMAREQEPIVTSTLASLTSRTTTGRGDELWYEYGLRRLLAPYNAVKLWDLDVHTPFLDRRILEWTRGLPDGLRVGKKILKAALARRHPQVADIPFARRSNLPVWTRRTLADPDWAAFFLEWCAAPGWLDTIEAKGPVIAALNAMSREAASGRPRRVSRRAAFRRVVASAAPGRALVEAAAARRAARNAMPGYLALARLAVLHGLLGTIRDRHGRSHPGDPVPVATTRPPRES